MFEIYITLSIIMIFFWNWLAQKLGKYYKKEWLLFIYFIVLVLYGAGHYRVFMEGEIGTIVFETNALLDISSFIFFISSVVMPVRSLSKSIEKNKRDQSKIKSLFRRK